MSDDFEALLEEGLRPAITGRPHHPSWSTEAFDWQSARERVEAVLERTESGGRAQRRPVRMKSESLACRRLTRRCSGPAARSADLGR